MEPDVKFSSRKYNYSSNFIRSFYEFYNKCNQGMKAGSFGTHIVGFSWLHLISLGNWRAPVDIESFRLKLLDQLYYQSNRSTFLYSDISS